jgi:hypothetical protein
MKFLQLSCTLFALAMIGCNADEGRGKGGGPGGGKDAGVTTDDDGGVPGLDDGGIFTPSDGGTVVEDPQTCDEAAANKSYIGCDYWPTVTANAVWNIFDFAAVVSNPGTNPATVTVTGPKATNMSVTVMPGALEKIYLPWVDDLKGPDADSQGSSSTPLASSVYAAKGAYHLVSSVPVLVYQFNALEYAPKNGPAGKDWSKCPGKGGLTSPPCFSYSNDASLLLPSTAMTGNYRVMTEHSQQTLRGYITITATQDNTSVKVQVSSTGAILASDPSKSNFVDAVAAGATSKIYSLNAGDVVELVQDQNTSDLSGSLVQADKPVQVIGGIPCIANPSNACDHVEETVMPAETLGKHYAVNMPTGPKDAAVAATIRFVGNADGTTLTYTPAVSGAPTTLNAGQVVEVDNVSTDFVVQGDHEFTVSIVQKSGSVVDPQPLLSLTASKGDPSISAAIAIEQYRLKYVFLAPDDYAVNYADVVAPMNATLMLDGSAVTAAPTQVGSTGYGVFRIKLSSNNGGSHTLVSDQPCGLQVLGYGDYTSYQYPGGLNLLTIAPPPPPIS